MLKNALGTDDDLTLPLGEAFFEAVRQYADFPLEADFANVWWAMDYHLDWIAGAMRLYDKKVSDKTSSTEEFRDLIQGTQEDVDLILAYGNSVLAIETKFDSPWNLDQANRKRQRIAELNKYGAKCDLPEIELLFGSARPRRDDRIAPFFQLKIPESIPSPKPFFEKSIGIFCATTRCNPAPTKTACIEYTQWKVKTAFARPQS